MTELQVIASPGALGEIAKPKLLFFRPTRTDLPEFVNQHLRDHVRALGFSFDVSLVTENADFDEHVDRVQPDLVLFESGVYVRPDRRIANTHRHPDIPRLGLLNADAYCLTRSVFLSDMDDWGVDTFFTIGVATAAHTPDIADRLYAWPNFADRSVFKSYPGQKTTTVLLAGSRKTHYPWRLKVDRVLRERFPTRLIPHSGGFDSTVARNMPTGEAWARTLSAAQIVPTCGTVTDELVRKHFEIPAAGALLLTERTAAVEAAGFIDMENAVFADSSDAADKVEYLLANPEVLERIATAGQHLAHERHDISHRNQLSQWLSLHRDKRRDEVIVQPQLFGKLILRNLRECPGPVTVLSAAGRDGRLLELARTHLGTGQVGDAKAEFAEVLNFHLEPEAGIGLARAHLRAGEPDAARNLAWFLIDQSVNRFGARRPDAVEWATYLRALIASGALTAAHRFGGRFPELGHPELRRIRHVIFQLRGSDSRERGSGRDGLRSVHLVPESTWEEWRDELATDLRACGQIAFSRSVADVPPPVEIEASKVAGPEPIQNRMTRPITLRPWRPGGMLGLAGLALRRAGRRWATQAPEDSIFGLLSDDTIEAVIAVLVDDPVALDALGRLVAQDPAGSALVRVGRDGQSALQAPRWGALGRRNALSRRVLSRLPALGPSLVVAGQQGGAYLDLSDLESAQVLVLLDASAPGHARLTAGLETAGDWLHVDAALAAGLSESLRQKGDLRAWRRSEMRAP